METLFCCECGAVETVEPHSVVQGEVYCCKKCGLIWGHLRPNGGGRAWIKIDDAQARFHRLISQYQHFDD